MFISNLAFLDVVSQETVVGGGSYYGGHKPPKPPKPPYNPCFECFEGIATAMADAIVVSPGGGTVDSTSFVSISEATNTVYSSSSASASTNG